MAPYHPPPPKPTYKPAPAYKPAPVHPHEPKYHPEPYKEPEYEHSPPKYAFEYGVTDEYSKTNFGHSESRDGYKTVGKYHVDLPDGRTQGCFQNIDMFYVF